MNYLEKASKHKIKLLEEKFNYYLKSIDFEIFKKSQCDVHKKISSELKQIDANQNKKYNELFSLYNTAVKDLGKF